MELLLFLLISDLKEGLNDAVVGQVRVVVVQAFAVADDEFDVHEIRVGNSFLLHCDLRLHRPVLRGCRGVNGYQRVCVLEIDDSGSWCRRLSLGK